MAGHAVRFGLDSCLRAAKVQKVMECGLKKWSFRGWELNPDMVDDPQDGGEDRGLYDGGGE